MEQLKKTTGLVVPELVLPLTRHYLRSTSKVFEKTPEEHAKLASHQRRRNIDHDWHLFCGGLWLLQKQNVFDSKTGVEQLKMCLFASPMISVSVVWVVLDPDLSTVNRAAIWKKWASHSPRDSRSNFSMLSCSSRRITDLLSFDFMDAPQQRPWSQSCRNCAWKRWMMRVADVRSPPAALPIDPSQGKTLLWRWISAALRRDHRLVLAVQNEAFSTVPRSRRSCRCQKRAFINEGDQITLMAIYNQWVENGMNEEWSRQNFVKQRLLLEARDTRQQLQDMLTRSNKIVLLEERI